MFEVHWESGIPHLNTYPNIALIETICEFFLKHETICKMEMLTCLEEKCRNNVLECVH